MLAFGKDDCFYLLCCCYYSNTLYKSIIVDSYRVVLDPLQLAHTHIHKLLNINHFLFCHKHLSLKPIPTNDTTSITNLSLVNLYSTFNVQTWYTCPFSTRWTITFPRTKTSPTNQFISTNPHHVVVEYAPSMHSTYTNHNFPISPHHNSSILFVTPHHKPNHKHPPRNLNPKDVNKCYSSKTILFF